MRSLAKHLTLPIFLLVVFGIVTTLLVGAVWLLIRAPQLLILGGVLLLVCCVLGTLAGSAKTR